MIDGVGSVVGGEFWDGRELPVSFEIVDDVDSELLESCGYKGRNSGPASESRAKLGVAVESEEGEGWREAAEKRSWIGAVDGEDSVDRHSREIGQDRKEVCEPRQVVGLD